MTTFVPLCPACGYDLTGLLDAAPRRWSCPECGGAFTSWEIGRSGEALQTGASIVRMVRPLAIYLFVLGVIAIVYVPRVILGGISDLFFRAPAIVALGIALLAVSKSLPPDRLWTRHSPQRRKRTWLLLLGVLLNLVLGAAVLIPLLRLCEHTFKAAMGN